MSKFGKKLIKSLSEALAHAKGKGGARVRIVDVPDLRAIRVDEHETNTSSPMKGRVPKRNARKRAR